MNVSEIVQSTGWKSFMAKLYGLGASVVIIGALFKIMHWPGASLMLIAGLTTEAIIFFFSAFEPLHEELDWTLVYPELAGMTDPDDMEQIREEEINSRGVSNLEKFEDIIKDANISSETFTRLGTGMEQLNQTVGNLSDISEATVASKQYMENVKTAAVSVDNLTKSYDDTSETLKTSVESLAQSYQATAQIVNKSGEAVSSQITQSSESLVNSYQQLTESIGTYYEQITQGGQNYGENLTQINTKLTMLNELYEQQRNVAEQKLDQSKQLFEGFNQMNKNLQSSVEETKNYKEELHKLSDNLASLNNIYGNMLSAMSVMTK
jgi:gliding motility-associated protein GldL